MALLMMEEPRGGGRSRESPSRPSVLPFVRISRAGGQEELQVSINQRESVRKDLLEEDEEDRSME